jgi:hypothetical protein
MSSSYEISQSWKTKNAGRLLYYRECSRIASASYETFISSWAGLQWKKKNQAQIDIFCEEQLRRFGQRWKQW